MPLIFGIIGWAAVFLAGVLMVGVGVFATWNSAVWSRRNDRLLTVSVLGVGIVAWAIAYTPFTVTIAGR